MKEKMRRMKNMSEFESDIGKDYDEEGVELDKHGFRISFSI